MQKFKRVIVIVLDGVGAGELPDADLFGDVGSNTLLHIHEKVGLSMPNLARMGLSGIIPLSTPIQAGAWGKMAETSRGKDTTTGHWEISGIILPKPFPTYPNGFPPEVIRQFCQAIGSEILGNCTASGVEIIQRLGDEHVKTKKPIVYTSADSVFQIAAHESIIPLPRLYEICGIARKILTGEHLVGRVIARPFTGSSGKYERSVNRHDFSVPPVDVTILDALYEKGYKTITVGKIEDIFAARSITKSLPVKGNPACIKATMDAMKNDPDAAFIFTNLVDFDTLYGHRNDPVGFRGALEDFDRVVPEILSLLQPTDLLIITADHGNDPTTPSTDHSREYVPLLVYHKGIKRSIPLGIRATFADVAKTMDEIFSLNRIKNGTSFYHNLI